MRVLITGGAGFIGSRTALLLAARGHGVRILDNLHPQTHTDNPENSSTWRLISGKFPTMVADICDRPSIDSALTGCDAVVHLAAETGTGQSMYEIERYSRVNVGGTALLLEAISERKNQVRRVVIASSRAIYGEGSYRCDRHGIVTPESRPSEQMCQGDFEVRCPQCNGAVSLIATHESSAPNPFSVYAVTKLSQELMVRAVCTANAVPWIALRYQNVYGPGQSLSNPYTGVLSVFSRLMVDNKPIEIFEDGLESRDFVFIDDIAAANVAAIEADVGVVGSMNVGSGVATSIETVVRELGKNYGYSGAVSVSGRFRAGDIRHNLADVSELRKKLGIGCPTSFSEGIAQLCSWVKGELAGVGDGDVSSAYRQSLAELERRGLIS